MSDFSIAQEFRFLALQCEAQAASTHRDQDADFVRLLAANIFSLGGHAAIEFIAHLIAEVMAPSDPIPDVLRRTADALHASAERLEARGRVA